MRHFRLSIAVTVAPLALFWHLALNSPAEYARHSGLLGNQESSDPALGKLVSQGRIGGFLYLCA